VARFGVKEDQMEYTLKRAANLELEINNLNQKYKSEINELINQINKSNIENSEKNKKIADLESSLSIEQKLNNQLQIDRDIHDAQRKQINELNSTVDQYKTKVKQQSSHIETLEKQNKLLEASNGELKVKINNLKDQFQTTKGVEAENNKLHSKIVNFEKRIAELTNDAEALQQIRTELEIKLMKISPEEKPTGYDKNNKN
jgi:chromosome segregation ATPase